MPRKSSSHTVTLDEKGRPRPRLRIDPEPALHVLTDSAVHQEKAAWPSGVYRMSGNKARAGFCREITPDMSKHAEN